MSTQEESIKRDQKQRSLRDRFFVTDEKAVFKYQATDEDWLDFPDTLFSYNSDNIFDVSSDIVIEDYFQVGDKIRTNQGGDFKHFYSTEIVTGAAQTMKVSAGDDDTFDVSAFTRVGSSRLASPAGHPLIFDYSTGSEVWTFAPSTWTNDTADFTSGTGSRVVEFWMNGPVTTFSIDIGTTSLDASITSVLVTSPFVKRAQSSIDNKLSGTISAGTTTGADIHVLYQWTDVSSSTPTGDLGLSVLARDLGTPYTTGTWGFSGMITIGV